MQTRNVYCPKCDQNVEVVLTPAPLHGGHANLSDGGEVVCLDFGEQCTGSTCAIYALPRVVMGVRLARSGLPARRMEKVKAVCEACQRIAELRVVNDTRAVCPHCETVNTWAMVRLDGEEWVAVTGAKAEAELA